MLEEEKLKKGGEKEEGSGYYSVKRGSKKDSECNNC